MEKVYYKVLTPQMRSVVVNFRLAVRYSQWGWTHPFVKNTPLMVFEDPENAVRFFYTECPWSDGAVPDGDIWECMIIPWEGKIARPYGRIFDLQSGPRELLGTIEALEAWWTNVQELELATSFDWPQGTVFAKAVRLGRKLSIDEIVERRLELKHARKEKLE